MRVIFYTSYILGFPSFANPLSFFLIRTNVPIIDFNAISTHLGLLHAKRLENRLHCMFICLNFFYVAWCAIFCIWFFRLLSSSLLLLVETQRFGRCISRPSTSVPCLSGHRDDSTRKIIFLKFDNNSETFCFNKQQ